MQPFGCVGFITLAASHWAGVLSSVVKGRSPMRFGQVRMGMCRALSGGDVLWLLMQHVLPRGSRCPASWRLACGALHAIGSGLIAALHLPAEVRSQPIHAVAQAVVAQSTPWVMRLHEWRCVGSENCRVRKIRPADALTSEVRRAVCRWW